MATATQPTFGYDNSMKPGGWPKEHPSLDSESSGMAISCFSNLELGLTLCRVCLVFCSIPLLWYVSHSPSDSAHSRTFPRHLSSVPHPVFSVSPVAARSATPPVARQMFMPVWFLQRSPPWDFGKGRKALNQHPGNTSIPILDLLFLLLSTVAGCHHRGT